MRALLAVGLCLVLGAACAPRLLDGVTPGLTGVAATATPVVPTMTATPEAAARPRTRAVRRPRAERTPAPLPTYGPAPAAVPSLDGVLDGLVPEPNPGYSLVMEDLTSGARVGLNDGQVFPSASLYKLGLAWLVLRRVDSGELSLDAPLPIEDEDGVEPEPAGGLAIGDSPTIAEVLKTMLSVSSNAAAHAFLRTLGRAEFNAEMARIGLSQTRVPEDPGGDAADGEALAVTTAADVAHLLRLLATSPLLSVSSRDLLMECLASTTPPDALRDTLPEGVDVLDKTGNLEDASNVGALLQSARSTVILVVLDHGVDPGDARGVIAQAGEVAYETLLKP
jgi:beta-lactamase class A